MRLVPENNSLARWLVLPFDLAAGAVLAAAAWRPELLLRLAHCPWREITGLPCPTCGGTHAAVALAQGRWGEAWRHNPLAPLLVLGLVAWSAWAVAAAFLPGLRLRVRWERRGRLAWRLAVVIGLVVIWWWQVHSAV